MSSSDDIVDRLRAIPAQQASANAWPNTDAGLRLEAADEIERLRDELALYRGRTGSRCGQQHASGHDCYRPPGHDGPHVAVLDEVEWDG